VLQSAPPYPDLHPPLVATFDAEQLIIFAPVQVAHALDESLK